MKRDLELCREILLRLEAIDQPAGVVSACYPGTEELKIDGWSENEIGYNADLMVRHDFFNACSRMDNGRFYFDGISFGSVHHTRMVQSNTEILLPLPTAFATYESFSETLSPHTSYR